VATISLQDVHAGQDIHLHHEEHHHYPTEQSKIEIIPKVDIGHLPTPTTALIGRKTEPFSTSAFKVLT